MKAFYIEIEVGDGAWKRVGRPHKTRECAKSWVTFVKKYWHAYRARVVEVELAAQPQKGGE